MYEPATQLLQISAVEREYTEDAAQILQRAHDLGLPHSALQQTVMTYGKMDEDGFDWDEASIDDIYQELEERWDIDYNHEEHRNQLNQLIEDLPQFVDPETEAYDETLRNLEDELAKLEGDN